MLYMEWMPSSIYREYLGSIVAAITISSCQGISSGERGGYSDAA
jgi:hypothetical protein